MRAHAVDTTVVQHNNAVGIHDARNALCDDNHRRIGNLSNMLTNLGVGRHIDRAGRIVKDEHTRMFEQRTRDAQTLFLSARDAGTALAQIAVESADAI